MTPACSWIWVLVLAPLWAPFVFAALLAILLVIEEWGDPPQGERLWTPPDRSGEPPYLGPL